MATKNFTQFSTATPLTTGDFIVGYKEDGSEELKVTVKQIIDLVEDSNNQTLSFNEDARLLSILNGNTVSLSSFDTTLESVSSLLTPLTLTNILTGQLVLDADFDSYKTEVASATATLLLTSIYQSASGNWQNTYNTFSSVSSTFLTSETESQTLNFNEINQELSITNGNTISLSSLIDDAGIDLSVRALTGNWEDTYNTVQVNSATTWNYQGTDLKALSSNWQSTYTVFSFTSALAILDGGNAKGQNITIGTSDAFHVRLRAGTSTRINILSSGEVGIGIVNPNNVPLGFPLTVNGTINSNTDGDSTQWKEGYDIGTAYSSVSSSFVTTVTTTVPGTSAVTSILAVSALPVVQETGVLYIVI